MVRKRQPKGSNPNALSETEKDKKKKKPPRPGLYGQINSCPPGSHFPDRLALSNARVHGPSMAGIHGRRDAPAFSIVLSGGYEDDKDSGDQIKYAGQGKGMDKTTGKKQVQGREQIGDQVWEGGNNALLISYKQQKPVRVIRGHKLDSPYAPIIGFRYDGLYLVKRAHRDAGQAGFQMCKFELERVEGEKAHYKIKYIPSERRAYIKDKLKKRRQSSMEDEDSFASDEELAWEQAAIRATKENTRKRERSASIESDSASEVSLSDEESISSPERYSKSSSAKPRLPITKDPSSKTALFLPHSPSPNHNTYTSGVSKSTRNIPSSSKNLIRNNPSLSISSASPGRHFTSSTGEPPSSKSSTLRPKNALHFSSEKHAERKSAKRRRLDTDELLTNGVLTRSQAKPSPNELRAARPVVEVSLPKRKLESLPMRTDPNNDKSNVPVKQEPSLDSGI